MLIIINYYWHKTYSSIYFWSKKTKIFCLRLKICEVSGNFLFLTMYLYFLLTKSDSYLEFVHQKCFSPLCDELLNWKNINLIFNYCKINFCILLKKINGWYFLIIFFFSFINSKLLYRKNLHSGKKIQLLISPF